MVELWLYYAYPINRSGGRQSGDLRLHIHMLLCGQFFHKYVSVVGGGEVQERHFPRLEEEPLESGDGGLFGQRVFIPLGVGYVLVWYLRRVIN